MSRRGTIESSLMLRLCATCRAKRYVTRSIQRTCATCRKFSSKIDVSNSNNVQQMRYSSKKDKSKAVKMQSKIAKAKPRSTTKGGKKFEHMGRSISNITVPSSKIKVKSPRSRLETVIAELVGGISVKTPNDTKTCWIKGSVMIPDRTILAAIDYKNECVKLVDVHQQTVVCHLSLSCNPWGITYVPPADLAVTLPNSKLIQFLTVTEGTSLSLGRQMCMSGTCYGITYNNDRLFVSFTNPGRLQIVSMSGEVLKNIDSQTVRKIHFTNPNYLTSSVDFSSVYVSDCKSHTVYCLDRHGKVNAIYKNDKLSYPTGVCATDDEFVVVCGYWSCNLNMMSSNCSRGRVLVEKAQNVHGIYTDSVAYCKALSTLYVGNAEMDSHSDTLKVYKLKG